MQPAEGPALVLLNPSAAGGRAAALRPELARWLERHAPAVPLQAGASVPQALQLLRQAPRRSRIVVAGGDGTLHHMLPALLERDHVLALLPCGTGNDGARAFGVHGLRWDEALAYGLSGAPRPTDIGELEADGRITPFHSSLAAGFDAAVAQRALDSPGWLRGMPRYLLALLRVIASLRPYRMCVEVDGRPLHDGEALFASALNTRSYGSGMPAAPPARIDDGRLDLLLAGRFGRAGALAMMPLLLSGQHLRHPRVRCLPFAQMTLRADAPLPLACDGEPVPDAARLSVRVRPGALAVVRHAA